MASHPRVTIRDRLYCKVERCFSVSATNWAHSPVYACNVIVPWCFCPSLRHYVNKFRVYSQVRLNRQSQNTTNSQYNEINPFPVTFLVTMSDCIWDHDFKIKVSCKTQNIFVLTLTWHFLKKLAF